MREGKRVATSQEQHGPIKRNILYSLHSKGERELCPYFLMLYVFLY